MPRKARKLSSCGVYHIMIRGINRMTIFNDDADNLNFLHILDFCADENFIIMAYCLMGNHLHSTRGKFSPSNQPSGKS